MPREPPKPKESSKPGRGSITGRSDGLVVARLGPGKDPQTGTYCGWRLTSVDYDVVERVLATAVKRRGQGRELGCDQRAVWRVVR